MALDKTFRLTCKKMLLLINYFLYKFHKFLFYENATLLPRFKQWLLVQGHCISKYVYEWFYMAVD